MQLRQMAWVTLYGSLDALRIFYRPDDLRPLMATHRIARTCGMAPSLPPARGRARSPRQHRERAKKKPTENGWFPYGLHVSRGNSEIAVSQ